MSKFYLNKNLPYYLLGLHGLLSIAFVLMYGFNTGNEGKKFLLESQSLLQSNTGYLVKYQLLNLTYIVYLLPFVSLGVHPAIIILTTHMITLFAYYKFYNLLKQCYTPIVAITWLAGMLLCPLFLYWNFSLYSESFFMALTLLFIYSLFQSKTAIIPISIGVLLVFCRPGGVFVIVTAMAFNLIYNKRLTIKKALAFVCIVMTSAFLFIFFKVQLHYTGVAIDVLNGSVICGIPKYYVQQFPTTQYTLASAYSFYIQQYGFIDLLTVLLNKAFSFFNITRSHYSATHNVINVFFSFLFVTNFIAFYQASKKTLKSYFLEILFIQIYIALNCGLVMLFFNEWTERYTLVVFPFLFLSTAFLVNHFSQLKANAV